VKLIDRHATEPSALSVRLIAAFAAILVLGLLLAAPALAGFEQVGTFGESGEGARLQGASGIAINRNGAGGVPAGTIYATADQGRADFVSRYSADGEFREAWGWGVSQPPLSPRQFERCGPDGEAAHPACMTENGDTLGNEGTGQIFAPRAVAVDQATGNVYVLNDHYQSRLHNLIQVFSPDGSQLIAAFGNAGEPNESIEAGPENLHNTIGGGFAVDASGAVYVADLATGTPGRTMVWKPQSPGDFGHYTYTGRANDIATLGVLAVDDTGDLYSVTGEEIDEFTTGEPAAPACRYEVPTAAAAAITVNPLSGEVFYFDYKSRSIHQLSACEGGEFRETGTIALTPKTEHLHALAFNPALAWEASRPVGTLYGIENNLGRGYIFAPAEVRLPIVESESVSSVTATTSTLGAQINPKGSTTRYTFQYIAAAAYEANQPGERFTGAVEAPLGGAVLGAGQESLGAAASLLGLAPDTEYHYRVIATSHCEPDHPENFCQETGGDQSFRTFPLQAPGLPDDRAWELVSPALKNGGEVFPLEPNAGSQAHCFSASGGCKPGVLGPAFPKQSSPDGEAVAYEGFPFSPTEGAARFNEYVSRRTSSGWQTSTLTPALLGVEGAYAAFNAELTQGVISQGSPPLAPDAPGEFSNFYGQDIAAPASLTPLIGDQPPNRTAATFRLQYAGGAEDFSHLFFAANDALTGKTPFTPAAVDGDPSKYNLYESVDGHLRLVNVLPGNSETSLGAGFGGRFFEPRDTPSAISANGSRVFWSDEAGHTYVRIDGESTLGVPDPGTFLTASEDGSKVLLDDGHLYDLETEAITDLTAGQDGFKGVAGQSDDLSRIYFVDTAVLTGEEENERGDKAQAGKGNIYEWSEGAPTFIATLLAGAKEDQEDWVPEPVQRAAQASPDGRWLAFTSGAQLSGYDNVGPCTRTDNGLTENLENTPCAEAFLYDSATGTLRCVSCNPSGVRPIGRVRISSPATTRQYQPQPRYLLDSGRFFFNTGDALSPFDTNRGPDGAGAEDVYEYEPEGVGSCERQDGCVFLISAGHEALDSDFLATDETGKNVFFTTRDQLSLKDTDDLVDLYDAREGGGSPSETETARGECQGEACVTPIVAPKDATPGSATIEGAGNVEEGSRPCPKGKIRRHGKCITKNPKSHKRHQRRGGASKQSQSGSSAPRAKPKHLSRTGHKPGGQR
jgi:hypothetical protein